MIRSFIWLLTISFCFKLYANNQIKWSYQQYLESVMKQNQMFESLRLLTESSQAKIEAVEIDLTPMLTASIRQTDDRRLQPFGQVVLDRTQVYDYQFAVNKKWSTGTTAQFLMGMTDQTLTFAQGPISSQIPFVSSLMGVQLSQSLWKDGFGKLFSLKVSREKIANEMSKLSRLISENQILIKAEQLFWDHLYLREELKQRQDSLARAKKIESWTYNRFKNGLAEDSDILGAKSLVALRELQMTMSQDDLAANIRELRQILQLEFEQSIPELIGNFDATSHPASSYFSSREKKQKVRIDSRLVELESKLKRNISLEVEEQLKPDVVLEAKYNTNSIEQTRAESLDGITDPSRPTSAIAIKFQYLLGSNAKESQLKAARFEEQSLAVKSARLKIESEFTLSDLSSRFFDLSKKIEIAERAASLQEQKAQAEQLKLKRGRAITSQVVQAEQEASESALTHLKLKSEQIKLLAQLRLFIDGEQL